MRAIQSTSIGTAEIVEVPEPELPPGGILVRPHYVANNPCDYFIVDIEPMFNKDQIIGCDYMGEVVRVGDDLASSGLKSGDSVCGGVTAGMGGDLQRGAFADALVVDKDFCFKVPKGVREAQAATLGVGISTIAVSFYEQFGLPLPDEDPTFGAGKPFFVYGGSTSTGLLAIQFAKLSGFKVITTCSPKNFALVKGKGADEAYDYHDLEQCAKAIRASVGNELQYAYNCVFSENAPKLCAEIISSKGGKYVTITPNFCLRDDVQNTMTHGQSVLEEKYVTQDGMRTRTPERKALGIRVWKMALKYLEEGRLYAPPLDVREGLEGALQGIDDLRKGKVSGNKIVSRLVSA